MDLSRRQPTAAILFGAIGHESSHRSSLPGWRRAARKASMRAVTGSMSGRTSRPDHHSGVGGAGSDVGDARQQLPASWYDTANVDANRCRSITAVRMPAADGSAVASYRTGPRLVSRIGTTLDTARAAEPAGPARSVDRGDSRA